MLLNNISVSTYAETDDKVTFVFSAGATLSDITSINAETLTLTQDGEQQKVWKGYELAAAFIEGGSVQGAFVRKLDDSTKAAIVALESNYITVKNMSENTQSQIDALTSAFETKEQ